MSVKDRGRIKWVSLMLPEHRRRLEELKEEEGYRNAPSLDEQQLEKLDHILQYALQGQREVKFLYHDGKKSCHGEGVIKAYHPSKREVILEGDIPIPLDSILDMEIL